MEIEKPVVTAQTARSEFGAPKTGDVLRVRVLRDLGMNRFLVDVKGSIRTAYLDRGISSRLFLAQVARQKPTLHLRLLKTLDDARASLSLKNLAALLEAKKAFIQKLLITDNFFVNRKNLFPNDIKNIRKILRQSIREQGILHVMSRQKHISRELLEYYTLQNLYNLLSAGSLIRLMFAYSCNNRRRSCHLQLAADGERPGAFLCLTLSIDQEKEIGFAVYEDFQTIRCSVASNDEGLKAALEARLTELHERLKHLGGSRNVSVNFISYDDYAQFNSLSVKRIDMRM